MGWRGTLRSLQAAGRAAERESHRRHRDLLRQQKERAKLTALQQATFEAELYENKLAVQQSIHKECSPPFDWHAAKGTPAPREPEPNNDSETRATIALEHYRPSLLDRLLRRVERKRLELEMAAEQAKAIDCRRYDEALDAFRAERAEWEQMQRVASGVLENEPKAFLEAIEEIGPLSEISELGSSLRIQTDSHWYLEIILRVKRRRGDSV